jgi:hypothetical protein
MEDIPIFLLRFADGKVAPKTWLDDLLEIPVDERGGSPVGKQVRQCKHNCCNFPQYC